MNGELNDRISEFVTEPVVLIACDYDGTLAPIVDDPALAIPIRESIVALRALATLVDTHVAVISGRALRDLAALSRLPDEVHLVGSHGSEFDVGIAQRLDAQATSVRTTVIRELESFSSSVAGSFVEQKPTGAAFHYRMVDRADVAEVVAEVMAIVATLEASSLDHIRVRHGKEVVEISVLDTDKGMALGEIRRQVHADAVIFIGDDTTDEDAFAVLSGPDIGIKVGTEPTIATFHVADTNDVARLLAEVCDRRRAWLEGDVAPAIERHSLLSDQRSVALVTPDARVSWFCHPRPDSPSIFAELLGGAHAGSFVVAPDPYRPPLDQRYVGESMVLETRWADCKVTDYLDASGGRPHEPAGQSDLIRVIEGTCRVALEFSPRLDYGRASTSLRMVDDSLVIVGAPESVRLRSAGIEWEIDHDRGHDRARAVVDLREGEPCILEMQLGGEERGGDGGELERRGATMDYWSSWVKSLDTDRGFVRRSALILKSMCHQPTGAILAAATTSLPEVLGGVRNWDYRFCWPRDAAVVCSALVAIGSTVEAGQFLDWLHDRVASVPSGEFLRPLYPLSGDEFLPEAVIPTLQGYRGSRPVRIGNLAERQLQLDMYGPIVELVASLVERGIAISDSHWDLVHSLASLVAQRWQEQDNGIWEQRRQPRHYVHSKVMCWVALDRAIVIGTTLAQPVPESWFAARDQIHADVLEHGWNESERSFTAAYGDTEIDAAVLQLVLVGFLPSYDPRLIATVAAVERQLRDGVVVRRYVHDDGLPGREGGFLLCTTWLIEALARIGRTDDARVLFARYRELAGPTGLFAEQYDPTREVALGNVPQGYSHAGLINAAIATGEA